MSGQPQEITDKRSKQEEYRILEIMERCQGEGKLGDEEIKNILGILSRTVLELVQGQSKRITVSQIKQELDEKEKQLLEQISRISQKIASEHKNFQKALQIKYQQISSMKVKIQTEEQEQEQGQGQEESEQSEMEAEVEIEDREMEMQREREREEARLAVERVMERCGRMEKLVGDDVCQLIEKIQEINLRVFEVEKVYLYLGQEARKTNDRVQAMDDQISKNIQQAISQIKIPTQPPTAALPKWLDPTHTAPHKLLQSSPITLTALTTVSLISSLKLNELLSFSVRIEKITKLVGIGVVEERHRGRISGGRDGQGQGHGEGEGEGKGNEQGKGEIDWVMCLNQGEIIGGKGGMGCEGFREGDRITVTIDLHRGIIQWLNCNNLLHETEYPKLKEEGTSWVPVLRLAKGSAISIDGY